MRSLNQFNRQLNDLLAKPQEVLSCTNTPEETDACPRWGASSRSLMPITLMCAPCRTSHAGQSWRAPITLRP
jgi:hypothetical protein